MLRLSLTCSTFDAPGITINPIINIYFKLSVQFLMSESDGLELKRCPSNQFPEFAFCSSNFPLSPKPLELEVQNGITVFPSKLFAFTNVSTGHAAIPHHIG